VISNTVQNATGTGLIAGNDVVAQHNRLTGNVTGLIASTGLISGNLIANNSGNGLQVGAAMVVSNTFTGNMGNAIYVTGGTPVKIEGNNLEGNKGTYDLYVDVGGAAIAAQNNWWGLTNTFAIANRIFDFSDDFNKAVVTYASVLTGPAQDAPAYVRSVTISPDSTLGIETGMFDVTFSRPMEQSLDPATTFYSTKRGTWTQYNSSNSGLPYNGVYAIAIDNVGDKWFGSYGVARFDGTTWTVYNTSNSGLPNNIVYAIAIDNAGDKWFGTDSGVARFDGATWTVYNTSNSGLPKNAVLAIAIDNAGNKWFSTIQEGGLGGETNVARFDGATWTVYNTSNSGLPSNSVIPIAIDNAEDKWFGTNESGVARFDGATWTVYNTSNSGLPSNYLRTIAIDTAGNKWFGTRGGVARFDGATWTVYNTSNSGLPNNDVEVIAIDNAGNKWFGAWSSGTSGSVARFNGVTWTVYNTPNSGPPSEYDDYVRAIAIDTAGNKWVGTAPGAVDVLWYGQDYSIGDNPQWLSPTQYRASYDITSLVPRGAYTITVNSAVGADGIEIATNSDYTFTVDYAGAVADTTPPSKPSVIAINDGNLTIIRASWSSSEPDSMIDQYRYAIGTTPGGRDVVNWTYLNATSVTRAGLNLVQGQTYYVTVGARNAGGLWSADGVSNPVVGGQKTPLLFLPLVRR
jgi:hypothetical protein